MRIRRLLTVGNTALAILLGYVVLKTMLGPASSGNKTSPQSAQAAQAEIETAPLPQMSAWQHDKPTTGKLFGYVADESGLMRSNAESTVGTKVNLQLLGTVAGPTTLARAVIRNPADDSVESYRTGQHVGQAKIVRIERNQVLLVVHGRHVLLRPGNGKTAATVAATTAKGNQVSSPATDRQSVRPVRNAAATAKVQWLTSPVESLLNTASLEPYICDGQTQGLRISGVGESAVARYIGLRDGDVIRSINGQSLSSKQKAFQVFKKAWTQEHLDVELLREDKIEKLSLTLK